MSERRPISELPERHDRFSGTFFGVDDHGRPFELVVGKGRRRVGSGGLVNAQIQAMRRGRPLMPQDMYEDVVEIDFRMRGSHRRSVEVLPNGFYRSGRDIERTLKGLVAKLVDDVPLPSAPPGMSV